MFTRCERILAIAVVSAVLGDALTTVIGLQLGIRIGIREANPFPLPLQLVGHLVPLVLLAAAWRFDRAVARWCAAGVCLIFGSLTFLNTVTILYHVALYLGSR